ncbi:MAG TPA: DUF4249 domain-containing protein [Paludibacter sp.]|nr:DUF4249 domain-containing protein [Paludibacter sp.]
MKNIIYTVIIAIALITVSCENEIEFKGNETNPLIVVNSFCTPDSLVKVHVSKSKFFLQDDSSFDLVNNAVVNLWINDVKIEKLSSAGEGFYLGTYKPKIGDKIKITAENNQFSEVSGTTEINQPVNILSVDTTVKILENTPILNYGYGDSYTSNNDTIGYITNRQTNFSINFNDPINQKNYYRLFITLRNYYVSGMYYDSPYYYSSDDLVFGNNTTGDIFGDGNYSYFHEFSDELFDGKKYSLKFYTNQFEYVYFKDPNYPKSRDEDDLKNPVKSELIINLQSISKSYYLYIKSRTANSNVIELFSEPVQIYSNVKGGIGVIGSYTNSVLKFEIPVTNNQNYYDNYGKY